MKKIILIIGASLSLTAQSALAEKFAVLDNNTVVNVIEGDANDTGFQSAFPTAVPLKAPGAIGSTYANGAFTAPPAAPTPAHVWVSAVEFMRRFTPAERITIRGSTDPIVVDFLDLLDKAQDVDVKDSLTQQAVGYLEQTGLIGSGRSGQILQ